MRYCYCVYEHATMLAIIQAALRLSNLKDEVYVELEIISPVDSASRIRPEKGINFPDSNLNVPSITSEDTNNLDFVVKHATAVVLSFVRRPQESL
jgi:pyruvate kinase